MLVQLVEPATPDGLLHGVVIGSAIARGRVTSVDAAEAQALPGVVAVITPATAPRLKPLPDKVQGIQYSGEGGLIEMLLPMQDDRIHYVEGQRRIQRVKWLI